MLDAFRYNRFDEVAINEKSCFFVPDLSIFVFVARVAFGIRWFIR